MIIPTPDTYKQWYAERVERTKEVMTKQTRVSGRQIKEQNLSAKVLYDAGYKLDPITDTMEKR
jgi:hypothetical protein